MVAAREYRKQGLCHIEGQSVPMNPPTHQVMHSRDYQTAEGACVVTLQQANPFSLDLLNTLNDVFTYKLDAL